MNRYPQTQPPVQTLLQIHLWLLLAFLSHLRLWIPLEISATKSPISPALFKQTRRHRVLNFLHLHLHFRHDMLNHAIGVTSLDMLKLIALTLGTTSVTERSESTKIIALSLLEQVNDSP